MDSEFEIDEVFMRRYLFVKNQLGSREFDKQTGQLEGEALNGFIEKTAKEIMAENRKQNQQIIEAQTSEAEEPSISQVAEEIKELVSIQEKLKQSLPLVTVDELATMLSRKPATIKKWFKADKITGYNLPDGKLMFNINEVMSDLNQFREPGMY